MVSAALVIPIVHLIELPNTAPAGENVGASGTLEPVALTTVRLLTATCPRASVARTVSV
jgi:hypothetical protein